jgi:hypothetical protein
MLRNLTPEERLDAQERAKALILRAYGDAPQRAAFAQDSASEYPVWIQRAILALVAIVLVAAFIPSAIRLYDIGYSTFYDAIPHQQSAAMAGLSIVILAEAAQVLFSIAGAVLPTSRAAHRVLLAAMLGATILALVGNAQVGLAQAGKWANPFAWLDALLPPLAVLATAYVLKGQLLSAIKQRHAQERAYSAALAQWRSATAQPLNAPQWPQAYANALRAALIEANSKGPGAQARKDVMAQMDNRAWKALVLHEMAADAWFSQDAQAAHQEAPQSFHQAQPHQQEAPHQEAPQQAWMPPAEDATPGPKYQNGAA